MCCALSSYYSEKNVQLFEELKVLDRTELQARATIMYEDYVVSTNSTAHCYTRVTHSSHDKAAAHRHC